MKTFLILIIFIVLFSCSKENFKEGNTLRNVNTIQGTWINQTDRSSLAFYIYNGSILYITTDTLKIVGDWYINDNSLTIKYVKNNVKYQYNYVIEELTDSSMILINQTKHFYKRQ
jgi:hypothetical protein